MNNNFAQKILAAVRFCEFISYSRNLKYSSVDYKIKLQQNHS